MYSKLAIKFHFLHVKSHQDDDGPVDRLTLETQLNIEADRLATAYLQQQEPRRPIALLFPSARCQFIINEKSVTRKIPQSIRFEAGSIDIKQYLMERNNWHETTLDDIHWDAHEASHNFHRPQRCFLIKLCHRHLPLGQTLHRRDPKYPPTCPGCRTDPETQEHFIQCEAVTRTSWRIKLLAALRRQMETLQTNTNLTEAILNCIDSAMASRAIPAIGPFQDAIEAQSRIGWLNMLRGHWTLEWQKAYEMTYPTPSDEDRKAKNKRKLTMTRWQKKVIQTMWGYMISLWTLRNEERHGWDKESRDRSRREVLHYELEEIYERKDQYPLRVQELLRATYKIHIQETVTRIADWLDAYKGTFAVTWHPD
jgi:hypothetical protein